MCESNVYLKDEEGEKLIVEDAVLIEADAGRIKITDILGGEVEIDGDIEEITFLDHRITIHK